MINNYHYSLYNIIIMLTVVALLRDYYNNFA